MIKTVMAGHDTAQAELLEADTTLRYLSAHLAAADGQIALGDAGGLTVEEEAAIAALNAEMEAAAAAANAVSLQARISQTQKSLDDWTIAEVALFLGDLGLHGAGHAR